MLRFDVYRDGRPAEHIDLAGAYVFGADGIPVRADVAATAGKITCLKRAPGAVGLAVLWDAGSPGRLLLPTARLPERKEPYNLNVELVRARVMNLVQKQEDWGLFDFSQAEALNEEFEQVRRGFVETLKCDDPAEQSQLADRMLAEAIEVSERVALFHADVFLRRRRASAAFSRVGFGLMVDPLGGGAKARRMLEPACDFISVPTGWKQLAPKERSYRWAKVDDWINWAAAHRRDVHAGPLVSFDPAHIPEWLYIWEHDYEALRDMIYEHIQHVVKRYDGKVRLWRVACGIHAHNSFNFGFEQIMELTRMSCALAKKLAPRSTVVIDLVMPWGEYYARNQRTVPPLLYADMAVQSGIKFDAFGVHIYMGVPADGFYVRDLMQISMLLDEFVGFGVPLHVTGAEVPSDVSADAWDAWGGKAPAGNGGHWHHVWNQRLQAEWLHAFCRCAFSKPFVESVCWRDLADYEGHYLPHGGLCRNDLKPKLSYQELLDLRAAPGAPAGGDPDAGAGESAS